jgi:hypothetical protein
LSEARAQGDAGDNETGDLHGTAATLRCPKPRRLSDVQNSFSDS